MPYKTIASLLALALSITSAHSAPSTGKGLSSLMDPHPIPEEGPWFQGWYNRWSDQDQDFSIAIITTSYLETNQLYRSGDLMKGYLALVIQRPNQGRPDVIELFPDETKMTSHGNDHLKRTDFKEKTDFRWESEAYGYLTEDQIEIEIPGVLSFRSQFGDNRTPWSPISNNLGPGSISSFFKIIPLHWYVYSLESSAPYELYDFAEGENYKGVAKLHQEKNWGEVFPEAWMWVQGFNPQGSLLALAGGQADLGFTETEAFMGSYRGHGHVVNFNPLNTQRIDKYIDARSGEFNIIIETQNYQLEISSQAPPDTFSVVSIPTEQGYQPGAIESFRATTEVKLWKKSGWILQTRELIATDEFQSSALEFGANYWDESS